MGRTTIFSSGLGGNWYTQTLPNASTKLLGQEIPCVNLSHTIFMAISCFLDPILGSDPGPAGPGQPEPRPSRAQVGPGSARQGFSRPALKSRGRESDLLPGGFAGVGNWICRWEVWRGSGIGFGAGRLGGGRESIKMRAWRRRIHNSGQGSSKSKPGKDFLDLR